LRLIAQPQLVELEEKGVFAGTLGPRDFASDN
jgi:hypothetical protein